MEHKTVYHLTNRENLLETHNLEENVNQLLFD